MIPQRPAFTRTSRNRVNILDYMARALNLARRASGSTSPNPAVGAVIVKDNIVIGEGNTQTPGSYHAEMIALHKAGARAKGSSIYVSLEPCCIWGRTPPCTRSIISAGVNEVHMAMLDPNPLVNGKGRKELETAGIRTCIGEHFDSAHEINEAYIKYVTKGIPFVIAKFAMSLDGKIATRLGDSKWITSEYSRKEAQNLRRKVDAILVGINTVLKDNPALTARDSRGRPHDRQPLRIVLDSKARIPDKAQILTQPGRTLLVVREDVSKENLKRLSKLNIETLVVPLYKSQLDLRALLKILGQRQIVSLLVEGGGSVLGSFFDNSLIDKVVAFISPAIIGGKNAKTAVAGAGVRTIAEAFRLNNIKVKMAGGDIILKGYV